LKKRIGFDYLTEFDLGDENVFADWVNRIVSKNGAILGPLQYIFVDDEYLFETNKQYLAHETYTDIITFDYSDKSGISGDIFISIERVKENADQYNCAFETELLRVIAHGVLHLLGFKDKKEDEAKLMRLKEDECIKLFHVEP